MSKFKNAFSKTLSWLKSNWVLLVVIVAVAALAWGNWNQADLYQDLFEDYKKQGEQHRQQIEDLKNIHNNERDQWNKLFNELLKNQADLKKEFDERLEEISTGKKDRQGDIIRDHDEDPNSLTAHLNRTFGIPVEQ